MSWQCVGRIGRHGRILAKSRMNTTRAFSGCHSAQFPMKEGTELKSLAICTGQDPPKVLPREEYPSWVSDLAKPLPTLAKLRRIPNEEAEEQEISRYLKLTRRLSIRQRNEESMA
ncbi:mitochondrial ribosomal protein L37 [Nitzschia inconspicua]|uniref:Large ribosomal subunit protein mL54 n=1 Tax=Nitzschia inconspicua TaxID=303405 RepID=A0A9K3L3Q7_9STRA|nr:mitochondrial ribosomal protein L37 [Nitzschia inconspicua]